MTFKQYAYNVFFIRAFSTITVITLCLLTFTGGFMVGGGVAEKTIMHALEDNNLYFCTVNYEGDPVQYTYTPNETKKTYEKLFT